MKILFLISILIFNGTSAYSEKLSLLHYLTEKLNTEKKLKIEKEKVTYQKHVLEAASDNYASSLALGYQSINTQRTFEDASLVSSSSKPSYIEGALTQNLAWGSSLILGTKKYQKNSSLSSLDVDTNYEVILSQSLLNNGFGKLNRIKEDLALSQLKAQAIELNENRIKICQSIIGDYLLAYKSQQEMRIFDEKLVASKKAFKIAQKNYKKRLIRKIDLLSSQADINSTQAEYNAQGSKNKINIKNLRWGTSDLILHSPKAIGNLKNNTIQYKDSYTLIRLKEGLKSSQLGVTSVKEAQKTDLSLKLSFGENQGDLVTGDYSDQYVALNISMDWPLYSKTNSGELGKSLSLLNQTTLNYKDQQINEKIRFINFKEEYENSNNQLELARQRGSILKSQVDEAYRLLKNGRIEFQDFVQFKNKYYADRISRLGWEVESFKSEVQLFDFQLGAFNICRGKNKDERLN